MGRNLKNTHKSGLKISHECNARRGEPGSKECVQPIDYSCTHPASLLSTYHYTNNDSQSEAQDYLYNRKCYSPTMTMSHHHSRRARGREREEISCLIRKILIRYYDGKSAKIAVFH